MSRKTKKFGLVNVAPGNGGSLPEGMADYEGLSTVQAARLLGCSPKTLENWRWRGIGVAYRKCGKRISYSVSAIRAYLAENTISPRG